MEVIYWQLVVAATTAVAYIFISRKASIFVVIFWTLWSLISLFYAPLIIIQLAVTWGSFFIIDRIKSTDFELKKSKHKLSGIEEATSQYSNNIRNSARSAEVMGTIKTLKDTQHYQYLLGVISSAKRSILVLSGWISTSVIDDKMLRAIEKALKRGVNVYIGFGYEDSAGRHQANPRSDKALESLIRLSNKCRGSKGMMVVGRFNNHQKILIKDELEVVCGSHNWLSNKAFTNREHSFIVIDKQLAKEAFSEFRPLIESRSIV